ncbi:MAG: hypothetical protein QXE18_05275 [Thermoplasmata archaeon]
MPEALHPSPKSQWYDNLLISTALSTVALASNVMISSSNATTSSPAFAIGGSFLTVILTVSKSCLPVMLVTTSATS